MRIVTGAIPVYDGPMNDKKSNSLKMTTMDIASSVSLMAYSASMVATPICLIVLMKEMNLNLSEGGGIEAVRTILLIAVLLISGLAASRFRKNGPS